MSDAISIITDQLASAEIYSVDQDGNKYYEDDDNLVYLLNHPNKFEGKEEFLKSFGRYLLAGGYTYIEPTSESLAAIKRLDRVRETKNRPEIIALNPDYIRWDKHYLGFINARYSGGKFNYQYPNSNKSEVKNAEQLIPFYDRQIDSCNPYKGVSRLLALSEQINNYYKSKKAKSTKIDSVGHFIISPSSKSLNGDFSITQNLDAPVSFQGNKDYTQKDLIEDNLMNGGLAQGKTVTVLRTEIQVNNLAESIQDYYIDNDIREDKREIYNEYNIPRELQNVGDDVAKYENRHRAELWLNSNVVHPIATNLAASIKAYYQHDRKIIFDWSHLPFYTVATKEKQGVIESKVNNIIELVKIGVYTPNEAKEIIENIKK